jgi:hypothetical protein
VRLSPTPQSTMAKRQWRPVRADNTKNARRHSDEWWEACSHVDVDALRREVRDGEFAKRTVQRLCLASRKMESWERQVLKELVAKEQLRRYKRAQRLERGMYG